jgi:hypothetical protein
LNPFSLVVDQNNAAQGPDQGLILGSTSLVVPVFVGALPGGGAVTLTASGLPSGITASFSPSAVSGNGGASLMTLSGSASFVPTLITITGTSASGAVATYSTTLTHGSVASDLAASLPTGVAPYTLAVDQTAYVGGNIRVTIALSIAGTDPFQISLFDIAAANAPGSPINLDVFTAGIAAGYVPVLGSFNPSSVTIPVGVRSVDVQWLPAKPGQHALVSIWSALDLNPSVIPVDPPPLLINI